MHFNSYIHTGNQQGSSGALAGNMSSHPNQSNAFFGSSNVGIGLHAALRSPLGYGEHVKVGITNNAQQQQDLTCSLQIPFVSLLPPASLQETEAMESAQTIDKNSLLGGSLLMECKSMQEKQHSVVSSYQQQGNIFSTTYKTPNQRHIFTYELGLMDEIPVRNVITTSSSTETNTKDAQKIVSFTSNHMMLPTKAILATLRSYSKHAFHHFYTLLDNRQPSIANANHGGFLSFHHEIGLISQRHGLLQSFPIHTNMFLKQEMNVQKFWTFSSSKTTQKSEEDGLVFGLVGSLGWIQALFPTTGHPSTVKTVQESLDWLPISER